MALFKKGKKGGVVKGGKKGKKGGYN